MVGVRPGVCVTDSRGFLRVLPVRRVPRPPAPTWRSKADQLGWSQSLVEPHPVAVVYVLVRVWPLSRRTSVRELTADITPGM